MMSCSLLERMYGVVEYEDFCYFHSLYTDYDKLVIQNFSCIRLNILEY